MASSYREYCNARDFIKEARNKLKDYKAIMNQLKQEFSKLKKDGIETTAFSGDSNKIEKILVTNKCWNHVFEHPTKRREPVERLARALTFPSVIKLLKRNTTYQEVSISKGRRGHRPFREFGIIGYIRGNRIKAVLRQDVKHNKKEKVLFSFYQLSSAPRDRQRKALHNKDAMSAPSSSVR